MSTKKLRDALFASDQMALGVGVEVYVDTEPRRYGVVVQMPDEDDPRIVVYEGPDHEYPGAWNPTTVRPTGHAAKGRVTDRHLDQRAKP